MCYCLHVLCVTRDIVLLPTWILCYILQLPMFVIHYRRNYLTVFLCYVPVYLAILSHYLHVLYVTSDIESVLPVYVIQVTLSHCLCKLCVQPGDIVLLLTCFMHCLIADVFDVLQLTFSHCLHVLSGTGDIVSLLMCVMFYRGRCLSAYGNTVRMETWLQQGNIFQC